MGVVEGQRVEGTTKSGRTRVVSIDDPAITLRVYAHMIRSAETAAADVFAKMLQDDCQ